MLAYLFAGMSVLCGFANFSNVLLRFFGVHASTLLLLSVGAAIAWYAAYKDIQLSALAMLWMEEAESATTLGDEAKDPLLTIPRAVIGSAIMAGLFFVVMAYIEMVCFSSAGVAITTTEEPLEFLSRQVGVGFLGKLVAFSALFNFFACVLSSINPAARVFFTMARHGLFPSMLGEAHCFNRMRMLQ